MELQSGGTRVNNIAVSRPTLRKAVFHISARNKTLDRYRAKTEGATINPQQIKTFIDAQSVTFNYAIDSDTKDRMRDLFGGTIDSMIEDAERVTKIISRQSRLD